jgi:8-oxo-dGTP pyrophosphatase MutT (NUDIX family)
MSIRLGDEVYEPMAQPLRQAAAIPVADGRVCLVTSSSGRRWVIPKGMIDEGHTAGEAALTEAWEEAGLVGMLSKEPVGSFIYEKYGRAHHVLVFVLHVSTAADDWPERDVRTREWVDPAEAIERVDDPGLKEIMEAVFRTVVAPTV